MALTEQNFENGILTLYMFGHVDSSNAPQIEKELMEAVKAHPDAEVVLNAASLKYISSAGLRVLLLAHKLMVGTGGTMTVRNPSEFCRQVFEATGMDSVLNIV